MSEVAFKNTIYSELSYSEEVGHDIKKDLKRRLKEQLYLELGHYVTEDVKYKTRLNITETKHPYSLMTTLRGELDVVMFVPEGGIK